MKWLGVAALLLSAAGCSTLRQVDTTIYGSPPAPLTRDTVVLVTFGDAITSSMSCSTQAFGPLGAFVPTHGCVVAKEGEPIRMILPVGGSLKGETRIVEFIEPEQAAERCGAPNATRGAWTGLPEGTCEYKMFGETRLRLIVPNPCTVGHHYLCHELGHVNQFAIGWIEASLSPSRHWGRPPEMPEFQFASLESPTGENIRARPVPARTEVPAGKTGRDGDLVLASLDLDELSLPPAPPPRGPRDRDPLIGVALRVEPAAWPTGRIRQTEFAMEDRPDRRSSEVKAWTHSVRLKGYAQALGILPANADAAGISLCCGTGPWQMAGGFDHSADVTGPSTEPSGPKALAWHVRFDRKLDATMAENGLWNIAVRLEGADAATVGEWRRSDGETHRLDAQRPHQAARFTERPSSILTLPDEVQAP